MTLNTSASLLYLIFVFSIAKGGSWVERLDIDEDYGLDCNAKVTCYMHSDTASRFPSWSYSAPLGEPPGFILGAFTSVGLYKYKQSATISKCCSKLVLTCRIDNSSKTVTLTSGEWVEGLYIGDRTDCNAKVTCNVHSRTRLYFIQWKCVGGPYGITDINLIPGLKMGDIKSVRLSKYRQSVTLSKCYSKLVLTCKVGGTSASVTLTSDGWIERLDIDEDYGSDCNAKVTCYVQLNTPLVSVTWKYVGSPYGISDVNQISGLRKGSITSLGFNKYKQSITLSKCYSNLVLTCEVDRSSKTVTLTSDPALRIVAKYPVVQIVGIVVGVVLGLSAIGGCVGLALRRRRRTQGAVVGGVMNPMTNPVSPTYPAQPIPAGYPGYSYPPPYPQTN